MVRRLGLLGGLIATAGVAVAAAPAAHGLYTAAQAAEGAQLYAQRCAMCHGGALQGTFEVPGLTGKFVANWAGRPLGDLYGYLGRAMPQFAPGTLAPEDNARIMAFILQSNGYPAGAQPLPADPVKLDKVPLTAPPPMVRVAAK